MRYSDATVVCMAASSDYVDGTSHGGFGAPRRSLENAGRCSAWVMRAGLGCMTYSKTMTEGQKKLDIARKRQRLARARNRVDAARKDFDRTTVYSKEWKIARRRLHVELHKFSKVFDSIFNPPPVREESVAKKRSGMGRRRRGI